jgi:hypothetical protein
VGNVACVKEKRNAYTFSVGKPEKKDRFEGVDVYGNIKMDF